MDIPSPIPTMLEQRLQQLALEEQRTVPVNITGTARHVKAAFGELLSTSPSTLLLSIADDSDNEAKMWDCFADVFEQEVQVQQQQQQAITEELSTDQKRQILADILVWAEVTQDHYDPPTAQFVTDPHGKDASFQRIGRMLKEAKAKRGL